MNRVLLGLIVFSMPAFAADTQWLCISDVTFTLESKGGKYVGNSYTGGEKFVVSVKGVKIVGEDDYLKVSDSRPMTCDVQEIEWSDGSTSIADVKCSFQGAHRGWGFLDIESNTLSFEARLPYEKADATIFFGHCTAL